MQDEPLLGENPNATVNAKTDMSQDFQLPDDFEARFKAYQTKNAPAQDYDVSLGDTAKAVGVGALGMVSGLGELSEQAFGVGESVRDLAQSGSDHLIESMTDDGKAALGAELFSEEYGQLELGKSSGDIDVWAMKFAQGLGSMAGVMVPGGVAGGVTRMVTTSMLKRGASRVVSEAVAKRTATILANTASTGTMVAGSHGSAMLDGREQVMEMDAEWLADNSEYFQNSLRRIVNDPNSQGMSNVDMVNLAKEETANYASKTIAGDPATIAASVAGAVGDRLLFGAVAGKATKGVLKGAGKGALTEAGTEALENAGQTYGVNTSLNEVAGTERDPWEGALKNAAEGAAIGALTGSVPGAIGGARGKPAENKAIDGDNVTESVATQELGSESIQEQMTDPAQPQQESVSQESPQSSNYDIPAYERNTQSELAPDTAAGVISGAQFQEDSGKQTLQGNVDLRAQHQKEQPSTLEVNEEMQAEPAATGESTKHQDYEQIRERVKANLLPEDQGNEELINRLSQVEYDYKFNDAPVDKSPTYQPEPYQDKDQPFKHENAQAEIEARDQLAQEAALQRQAEEERADREPQPEVNPNWIGEHEGLPVTRTFMRDKVTQELQPERDKLVDEEQAAEALEAKKQDVRGRLGQNTEGKFNQFSDDAQRIAEGRPTQQRVDELKSQATERELERAFNNRPIKSSMSKRLRRKIQRAKGFDTDAVLAEFQNNEKRLQAYQEEARLQAEREANNPENIQRRKDAQSLFEEKLHSPEAKQFSESLITDAISRVNATLDKSTGTVLEMDGQQTSLPKVKAQMANSIRNLANKFVGKTAALNESLRARRSANEEVVSQVPMKQVVGLNVSAETTGVEKSPVSEVDGSRNKPESPEVKIEDFGQKIGNARKDVWADYAAAVSDTSNTQSLPLSKSFPEPDYKKLSDNGADKESLALIAALRNAIPSKPRNVHRLATWIRRANGVKEFASGLLNGSHQVSDFGDHAVNLKEPSASILRAVPSIAKADPSVMKEAAKYRVTSSSYSMFNGQRYSPSKTFYHISYNGKELTKTASESLKEVQSTLDSIISNLDKQKPKTKQSKVNVYLDRGTKQVYLGWKGSKGVLRIQNFDSSKEARAYLKESRDQVEERLAKLKRIPNLRRESNAERVGPSRYKGNVSSGLFSETFGFRGVEFGNWVEQGKRQTDLNDAFDGLHDLAEILGIPPKALSLNGELGLAFGARGKGGKDPASAHYESGKIVINLTKKSGAGSLAHEWFHAVDHYFGRSGGPYDSFISTTPYVKRIGQREEVQEAFTELSSILRSSDLEYRSSVLDQKKSKPYYSEIEEMGARSFESYIIDELESKGMSNDYLANIIRESDWIEKTEAMGEGGKAYPYPYPTEFDKKSIFPAFKKLFDTLETKPTDKGIALFSREVITDSKPEKGMTLKNAQLTADQWLKAYRGGAGVKITVVKTQAEAEELLGTKFDGSVVHALYKDSTGETVVVADNIANPKQLRQKLRHEVLVHHGLKAVVGDSEYQRILQRVYRGKNSPHLKELWDKVETNYSQFSAVDQVEEVLAHAAEFEGGKVRRWLDGIIEMMSHALRKVGLMRPSDMTKAELNNIVRTLADRTRQVNHWLDPSKNPKPNATPKLSQAKFSRSSRVPDEVTVIKGQLIQAKTIPEMRLKAKSKAFSLVGEYTNKETGHRIQLSKKGIKHTIQGARDELLSSVPLTDKLIEESGYLGQQEDKKGNPSVKAVHRYGVKYEVNGNTHDVVVVVREMPDGKFYYDHAFKATASDGNDTGTHLRPLGAINPRGVAEADTSNISQKTANNNESELDRNTDSDDIHFSMTKTGEKSQDDAFGLPTGSILDIALTKFSDKFKPVKDLQASIEKVGGKVTEDTDVYLAEELFHGKAENDLRLMKETFVQPLVKKMAEYGITQDELDNYMIAKHAKERNEHIASINLDMPDGGSGMKTADAETELNRIKNRGEIKKYQDLASIVYAMNQRQRDLLVDAGLEDDGLVSAWEDKYQYYVPLKGRAADQNSLPKTGKGFSIGGKESKRAMGRKSLAKSPSSQAIVDLSEKLIRAQKNQVANAMLQLALDNPNPEVWSVYTQDNPDTHKQITTEDGKEIVKDMPVPMALMSDKYLPAKKDGKVHYIKLKDERLMKAMKNITPDTSNFLINAMSKVNRYLAAVNTSFNPEFVIGNFSRDIQTALLNLKAEESRDDGRIQGEKIAAKTIKDIGKAGKVIFASLREKKLKGDEAKWQQYYEEFLADGGKTGFLDLKDVDSQRAELEAMLERESGTLKGKSLKALDKVINAVEKSNYVVENSTRLSAYVNARKAGLSRKKAASLAKNMTVNFNRKGSHGQYLSAMYLFANASIQGSANFVRTMYGLNGDKTLKWKNLNTAQKIAIGMMGASATLAVVNRAGAGEDDDGENWYSKVPDYEKERNIIIMKSLLGGEPDGSYWKIPLPYGYNIFSVLGTSVEAVGNGGQSALKAAANVTTALASSFSPIGFSESETGHGFILKNALPTITNPLVELALNENFMGKSIYTENSPFGTPKPDSSLGRRHTPQAYKDFAMWVNDAMGGSEFRSGLIDINPDSLKYLMNYLTGGAGRFISDKMIATPMDALQGSEDIEARNVMFLSRISGRVMPYEDQSLYYQRRDELAQIHDEYKFSSPAERQDLMKDYRGHLSLYRQVKKVDKQLKALRKRRDAVYGSKSPRKERELKIKAIERQMKSVIDGFNQRYNLQISRAR